MSFRTLALSTAAALALTLPVLADEAKIMVEDAYARAAMRMASSGAAFMVLVNRGEADDRLVDVRSDIARRVELHTNISDANGVMKMVRIEGGIEIPAGGRHALARGGDHVMFMGLKEPLEQGGTVPLTLVFEKAGEIEIKVPVDMNRKPGMGMKKMKGMKMDMQDDG